MLDEHSFLVGHGEEELMKRFLIAFLKGPQRDGRAVFQVKGLGESLKLEFEGHVMGLLFRLNMRQPARCASAIMLWTEKRTASKAKSLPVPPTGNSQ
jgi:hypothetical protein